MPRIEAQRFTKARLGILRPVRSLLDDAEMKEELGPEGGEPRRHPGQRALEMSPRFVESPRFGESPAEIEDRDVAFRFRFRRARPETHRILPDGDLGNREGGQGNEPEHARRHHCATERGAMRPSREA